MTQRSLGRFLAPITDRLGLALLGRGIRRRIAGFATGCDDPQVLAAASETAAHWI